MLRAYLDDSGSNDSDVLAIGGGISWPDKWGAFEHELRSFLTTHSLDMLHMSELKWDGMGKMMMDPLSEARSHSCINMWRVTSDAVFGQRTLP